MVKVLKKQKKTTKKIVKKQTKKRSAPKTKASKKNIKLVKSIKLVKKAKTKKVQPASKKRVIKKKVISKKKVSGPKLVRSPRNPIIEPRPYVWESQAVFNPAVVSCGGRVHLFYRAMGTDGISRIGYASSKDGINFDERLSYPVYFVNNVEDLKKHWPYTSPARPIYDNALYSSGGGWGGCEDPRAVLIDGHIYMTFNMFNGWNSMRVAVISINEGDLSNKKWFWKNFSYLSKTGDRQKNWVLFPEKINGKFAIFHNLDKGDPSRVSIAYVNKLDMSETPEGKNAPDPHTLPDHIVAWHKRTRSAAAPPIKTKDGWLLLYHAMDKNDGGRYKLGALLLDLKDPEKVLYRAQHPILEPDQWYENDWKPGIIYASGALIKPARAGGDARLFVYYGGGDKHIAVASVGLSDLIKSMKENGSVKLEKNKSLKFE